MHQETFCSLFLNTNTIYISLISNFIYKKKLYSQYSISLSSSLLYKEKPHIRLPLSLQVDSERSDASHLKREHQTLLESCDSLEKSRQKAVHDLGIKEQQVGHHQNIYRQCVILLGLPLQAENI